MDRLTQRRSSDTIADSLETCDRVRVGLGTRNNALYLTGALMWWSDVASDVGQLTLWVRLAGRKDDVASEPQGTVCKADMYMYNGMHDRCESVQRF